MVKPLTPMSEPLHKLHLHLRDLGTPLVEAWRAAV